MSMAEKLQTIAENELKVYDAGKAEERRLFWETNQQNGNRENFQYAYIGHGFSFENFFPKFDIKPKSSANAMFYSWYWEQHTGSLKNRMEECGVSFDFSQATNLNQCFYMSAGITEIPTVQLPATATNRMFAANCSSLETIEKVVVQEETTYTQCFDNDTALVNITFEGVIANTGLNFQWSPLSVASMKNIISCLKDFTATEKENTCSIKFSDDCWAALESDSTAPDGTTWREYVQYSLKWNI